MAFTVFKRSRVELSGTTGIWLSKPWYERHFCTACGSRIAGVDTGSDEIELPVGAFDDVGVFMPQYENWVIRREPWLEPLEVPQHPKERTA